MSKENAKMNGLTSYRKRYEAEFLWPAVNELASVPFTGVGCSVFCGLKPIGHCRALFLLYQFCSLMRIG